MIAETHKAVAGDGALVHGYEISCANEGCGAKEFMVARKSTPPEMVPKHFARKGWEIQTSGKTICAGCLKKRVGAPPKSKIALHGTQVLQALIGLPLTDKNMEKIARNCGLPVDTVTAIDVKKHDKKYRLTMLPHADINSPMLERALREIAQIFDITIHSSVLAATVLQHTTNNILMIRVCMVWTVTMDKRE